MCNASGRAAVSGQPGGGAEERHHNEGLLHRASVRTWFGHPARGEGKTVRGVLEGLGRGLDFMLEQLAWDELVL